jgi:hypothetical protein
VKIYSSRSLINFPFFLFQELFFSDGQPRQERVSERKTNTVVLGKFSYAIECIAMVKHHIFPNHQRPSQRHKGIIIKIPYIAQTTFFSIVIKLPTLETNFFYH